MTSILEKPSIASTLRGGGRGRWAACADDKGVRCGRDDCRSCVRNEKEEARRERKKESEKNANSDEFGHEFERGGPPELQEPTPVNDSQEEPQLRGTPGLIHRTQIKPKMPATEGKLPVDFGSFGPADPGPVLTEEEEVVAQEAEQAAEERQERIENPNPFAVMIVGKGLEVCQQMLKDADELRGSNSAENPFVQFGLGIWKDAAIRSATILLPDDVEMSDNMCHVATATGPALLYANLKLAQKQHEAKLAATRAEEGEDEPANDERPVEDEEEPVDGASGAEDVDTGDMASMVEAMGAAA